RLRLPRRGLPAHARHLLLRRLLQRQALGADPRRRRLDEPGAARHRPVDLVVRRGRARRAVPGRLRRRDPARHRRRRPDPDPDLDAVAVPQAGAGRAAARRPRLALLLLFLLVLAARRHRDLAYGRAVARAVEAGRQAGRHAAAEHAPERAAAGRHLLDHLAHLLELLEQLVDLFRGRARAARDAPSAAAVDDRRVGALGPGHRADDRLDVLELIALERLARQLLGDLVEAGQQLEELPERAHPLELL